MSRKIATRKLCLNCGRKTVGIYCVTCGQKTNTERLSAKNFLTSEFLTGVLNLNRGFLFTLKEVIINPGKVANEYILGKRIKYYNIFYLTIIIITVILIFRGLKADELITNETDGYLQGRNLVKNNFKVIILLFIPIISISSRIIYRKIKMNLAEHAIVAGICVANLAFFILLLNMTDNLIDVLKVPINDYLKILFIPLPLIVSIRVYYLTFKKHYVKKRKSLVNATLNIFLFMILLVIIVIPILTFLN